MKKLRSIRFPALRSEMVTAALEEITSLCEMKVLLYIAQRTIGFGKQSDAISFSQFVSGITHADHTKLDNGVGFSKSTVQAALSALEEKGFILRDKRTHKSGGNAATVYSLKGES